MSTALKLEITRRSYSVEIPLEDFIVLTNMESILGDGPLCNDILSEKMEKQTGARLVEYNGHFGNYIYFSLDADDDTPEEQAKILKMIEEQIVEARNCSLRLSCQG